MPATTFVPHHARVTAPGATPDRHLLLCHGILGSGANFRSFARRLAERCPRWGFVLCDLRCHGASQGAPPPHTVESAARDLVALGEALHDEHGVTIDGVLGHSFGGKVALQYLDLRRTAKSPLDLAFILDASPSRKPGGGDEETSAAVIRMLRALPDPLPSRERFVSLVMERGFSKDIADWLAMNVRLGEGGLRFRLDLDAIEALLGDYFAQDLWPVLEDPGSARALHVILGGRSDTVSAEDRARLATLPWVHTEVIAQAGHWVHVDAPDALLALVGRGLSNALDASAK
ncbi:MAG: alpha/beta fold hydrolase [Byssovorax sp.]